MEKKPENKKSLTALIKSANIIDVIAVILIVLVGAAVLWKIGGKILAAPDGNVSSSEISSGSASGEEAPNVHVTYVVKAENVEPEVYENIQKYIPGQLMAAGEMYDAWVVTVEQEPAKLLNADGVWVEDTEHVTLRFTVEADIPFPEVMNTMVGNQEVRIGKPGYILKTEYLEIRDTTVIDVQWEGWDFGASRAAKETEEAAK